MFSSGTWKHVDRSRVTDVLEELVISDSIIEYGGGIVPLASIQVAYY
jgi:hypothetical protein